MLINILAGNNEPIVKFIMLLAMLGAFLLAIVLHETAHGFAAYKSGDNTAKMMGRLTLNPIKHFDLIGFIMLMVVGFGWARPVPINPMNFRNYKKGMVVTSLAGVITNLITAVVSAGLLALFLLIFRAIGVVDNIFAVLVFDFIYSFFLYSIVVNLTLMAFNILPIYPLDGYRLVETLTRPDNPYVAFMQRYGQFVLLGLILGSNFLGRINPALDIFGTYINFITNGFINLFSAIFKL